MQKKQVFFTKSSANGRINGCVCIANRSSCARIHVTKPEGQGCGLRYPGDNPKLLIADIKGLAGR